MYTLHEELFSRIKNYPGLPFLQTYKPYCEGLKCMWHSPLPLKMLLSSISFFLWVNQNNLAIFGCLWSCQYYFLFLFEELSSKSVRKSCAPHSVVCFTTKPKSSLAKFLSFAYSLLIHYSVSTFTRLIKLFAIEWLLVIPLAEDNRKLISYFKGLRDSCFPTFTLCVQPGLRWDGMAYTSNSQRLKQGNNPKEPKRENKTRDFDLFPLLYYTPSLPLLQRLKVFDMPMD